MAALSPVRAPVRTGRRARSRAWLLAGTLASLLAACGTTPPAPGPDRPGVRGGGAPGADPDPTALEAVRARAERLEGPARLDYLVSELRDAVRREDAFRLEALLALVRPELPGSGLVLDAVPDAVAPGLRGPAPGPLPAPASAAGSRTPGQPDAGAEVAAAEAWLALLRDRPDVALTRLDAPGLRSDPADRSALDHPFHLARLRARVLDALGRHRPATRAWLRALPWTAGAGDERASILDGLAASLMRFGRGDVRAWQAGAADAPASAVGELAALLTREYLDPGDLRADLVAWRGRWAGRTLLGPLADRLAARASVGLLPERIALLLPLSGRFAPFGRAVADGFAAAYFEDALPAERAPLLTFVDSTGSEPSTWLAEARASGSRLVVGPLLRHDVAALTARVGEELRAGRPTPDWLLLNVPEGLEPAPVPALQRTPTPGDAGPWAGVGALFTATDGAGAGGAAVASGTDGPPAAGVPGADAGDGPGRAPDLASGPGRAGAAAPGTAPPGGLRAALFDLRPEIEGRRLAERALAEDLDRALVLTDGSETSARGLRAWEDAWRRGEGAVVGTIELGRAGDAADRIAELLLVRDSERRADGLDRLLDDPFEFEPRRRGDFDVVLLFADHAGARAAVPALRYWFVSAIPVLAGTATAPPEAQVPYPDLDGLRLLVPNWLLGQDPVARTVGAFDPRLQRFAALGADAYRAVRRWPPGPGRVPGSGGTLEVGEDGRITVAPAWGWIRDGAVEAMPVVVDRTR